MMNIREAFAEAEILKDASPSVLADLASCASLRRVKCGSHLFLDKEEVTTLYVMVEGMTASRVRVPGGHLEAKYLGMVQEIAEEFGNGTVHITSRQGFEIPGIPFEKMPEVNSRLQPIIEGLGINQTDPGTGYPASGTRNITACPGNRICPYACYDTTAFAQRIEKAIFPNDLHFKVALTGCPNDCAKVRMHDFGIIGMLPWN